MTKRILALLLALTMVFSVLPTGYAAPGAEPEPAAPTAELPEESESAASESIRPEAPEAPEASETPEVPAPLRPGDPVRTVYEGSCGDELSWSFDDATGVLSITGTGAMNDFGYGAAPWAAHCDGILAVELPEGLSSIGGNAFQNCTNLSSVTIPASVTRIGSHAFRASGLSSIHIPANVTELGTNPFCQAAGITSFSLDPANTALQTADGLLLSADGTILYSVAPGKTGKLTVPSGVNRIKLYAAAYCAGLSAVELPVSVRYVEQYAFYSMDGLTEMTVSATLMELGTRGIAYCPQLTRILFKAGHPISVDYTNASIGNNNAELILYYTPNYASDWNGYPTYFGYPTRKLEMGSCGTNLFYELDLTAGILTIYPGSAGETGTMSWSGSPPWYSNRAKISSVILRTGTENIAESAFYGFTKLVQASLPEGMHTVGPQAFYNCGMLKQIVLPSTVSTLGYNAFYNCSQLESATLPGGLQTVPENAFRGCTSLTGIELPASVTSIAANAFYGCSALESVTLPEGLTRIYQYAFYSCGLTAVTIPSTVSYVDSYAFRYCSALSSARFLGAPPTSFYSYVFHNAAPDFCIYYPAALANLWAPNGETSWKGYPIAVQLESIEGECGDGVHFLFDPDAASLTIYGAGAMADYAAPDQTPWAEVADWIERVVVEDGVTAVGDCAFAGLENLETVSLGADLARIGDFAFLDDAALTELALPAALTQVNGSAFVGCAGLTRFEVETGNTALFAVGGVLYNAAGTELIAWPNAKAAYYTVPDGVLSVGSYAFAGASDLLNVVFPETLSAIGQEAFRGSGLQTAVFPEGSVSLGDYAFADCADLEVVGFLGVLPTVVGEGVFVGCADKLLFLGAVDHDEGWYAPDVTAWQGYPIIGWRPEERLLGRCGDTLLWAFDETTGLLTVTGVGAMYEMDDFEEGCYPWNEYGDQITAVKLREGLTSIGDNAFGSYENLSAVSLPATLAEIGEGALHTNPSLESLTLAAGSQSFTLNDGLLCTADGEELILCLPAKTGTLTVPAGTLAIRYAACALSGITELVLPDGLAAIGDRAFADCAALVKLTPLGGPPADYVGEEIFEGCHEDLTVWITEAQEPAWDDDGDGLWYGLPLRVESPELPVNPGAGQALSWSFDSAKGILHVTGTGPMFDFADSAPPWSVHKDAIKEVWLEEGVSSIGARAFFKYPNLHTVRMPDSLTAVNVKACYGCAAIETLIIPPYLDTIGDYAFAGCSGLDSTWYRNNIIFTGNPPANVGLKVFGSFATNGEKVDFLYDNYDAWGPYLGEGWHGYDIYYVDDQAGDHIYVGYYKFPGYRQGIRFAGYGDIWDVSYGRFFYFWDGQFDEAFFTKGITAIGDNACAGLTVPNYELPEGLERIGCGNFSLSYYLESVSIPASVTEIDDGAFAFTPSLTDISVDPDNPAFKTVDGVLYSKDGSRLLRCPANLTGSFTIPEGVISVDTGAFSYTDITELIVPASVTSLEKVFLCPDWIEIGEYLNETSSGIAAYVIAADNPKYCSVDGVLYNKDCSVLLSCPPQKTGEITLPATVCAFGDFALLHSQISAVNGLERVTSFGRFAFAYSRVERYELSGSLTALPEGLFYGSFGTEKLTVPASVQSIHATSFAASDLYRITFLGEKPTLISSNSYDIPMYFQQYRTFYFLPVYAASWTADGGMEWYTNKLIPLGSDLCGEDVHWSYSNGSLLIYGEGDMQDFVTHADVPWYGFADQITEVVVEEGVTGVGAYAFAGLSNLRYVDLPWSLTSLGAYAFAGDAALQSVALPDGLETVGIRAFFQSGLTESTIPASVTSLGESAFQLCPDLKLAVFEGEPPAEAGARIFDDCHPAFCIDYPTEFAAAWRPNGDETEWHGWPLALSVENQCGIRMYWAFDSATATLSFYGEGEMYDYETSSSTRPPWYSNYSGIQHIVLSEGITRVGNYAFYGFNKVVDLSFPSSLREIGTGAFWNCSLLNNVVLPANLETLGNYAFYNCQGLTALSFNDKLKSIGGSCFQNCYYLAGALALPEGLETLGSYAFSNCRSYTAISVPCSLKTVGEYAFTNCYGAQSLSLGEGVERIGRSAFDYCYGFTELSLPASLRELGTSCFQSCSGLTSITIPEGVTTASTHVFASCSGLTAATILAPWESIPDSFFYSCSKLENLSFPATVTKLGSSTFSYCKKLTDFSLFSDITEFGSMCFQGTGFSSVTLSEGVTVIPTSAFAYNTDLSSFTILGPVTSIGSEAFRGCSNLESFELPDSLLTLGGSAFYGCSKLQSVTIPEGVSTVASSCFYNCTGLESLSLPNSLSLIDQNAFYNCKKLTEVTFGYGLQRINYGAFNSCSLLSSATFRGPAPTLGSSSGCFSYVASGFTIYYYAPYANTWSPNGETTWGNGYPISMLGSAVPGPAECGANLSWSWDADARALTVTGSGPMYDYSPESPAPWACYAGAIESVTLESGVSSVGAYAFYACTALTDLTLTETLTSFGDYAFAWCVKLSSAVIPAPEKTTRALTNAANGSVGNGAFQGCAALSWVELPAGTLVLGQDAFKDCKSLRSIELPETLTAIGSSAFRGSGLSGLVIPGSVNALGDGAFQGCGALYNVTFLELPPETVGEAVFHGCGSSFCVSFQPMDYCTWTEGGTVDTWESYPLDLTTSSYCGETLRWSFNESTGVLQLYGSGEAYAYDAGHPFPWSGFKAQITEISLADTVTEIPAGAFEGCTALSRVLIPASIEKIGSRAFAGCTALTEADFWGEPPAEVGGEVFAGCASGFRVCYLIELTGDWAPEGETTWHGWPLVLMRHRISFLNPDGTLIEEQLVLRDTAPTPPAAPARPGWVFTGWMCDDFVFSADAGLPAARYDRSYTAVYERDLADGFYLIRPDWLPENIEAAEKFSMNPGAEGEYLLNVTLTEGELITVARVESRRITALYPEDFLPGYTVDAAHAGSVTVYFRETLMEDWADFGGYIFIGENLAPPVVHFTDVPDDAWYADAVAWALENNVTAGTSETSFSPDLTCTRAQIVTFLWRAMGSPEAELEALPFCDVPESAYYALPAAWAWENGVSAGTGPVTFSPNRNCTRAQIITMLWSALGKPQSSLESCPFSDVLPDDYYRSAVLWAVENGITGGVGDGLFGPAQTCTRAEAVTFLWKALGQ